MTPAPDAWNRGKLSWDVFFALVLAGTLVLVGTNGDSVRSRVLAAAALLAAAAAYLLLGRRVIWQDGNGAAKRTYVVLLVALVVAAQSQNLAATWILFAACPQAYMIGSVPQAVSAIVVLNLAPMLVAIRTPGFTAQDVLITAGIGVVGLAFSVVYGTWIRRIIDQSKERAGLIAALERAQGELAEVSRDAGRLAERQRLAGEIHDTIAQGLTSIVTLLQAAQTELDADPEQARRHLELSIATAREGLAEARAMVAGLAPAHLAGTTLPDALRRLTERIGTETGVAAGFEVNGPERPLPPAAEVVLLRCGQEALANVRKHARASEVTMLLRYQAEGSGALLEVSDDGAGFDPVAVNGGFGLRGMRDRLERAGGHLAVRTAPGEGTRLSVEVPE